MTSLTLARPTILRRILDFWTNAVPAQDRPKSPDETPDQARARRDFALEMLDRYPDAFQSELDLETMSRLYRCKY
jgi:hypothetical protein